ncbi:MAG TPA: hypothetical protein DCL00_04155 [Opitutae bacterium]|nr:hypothetical protein [Opitutae bacterium]
MTNLRKQSKRNEKKIISLFFAPQDGGFMFKELMNKISQLCPTEQKAWHDSMLDHCYDIKDWEDARSTLINLLTIENRQAEEKSIRSYVSCCAEAVSGSLPLPELSATVEDFFARYGMEDTIPEV